MLDTKKIEKRIEAMKKEVQALGKLVEAERKRLDKLDAASAKKRDALDEKRAKLADAHVSAEGDAQIAKLAAQIDAIDAQCDALASYYEVTCVLGEGGDYPEDSLLGALSSIEECLGEIIHKKGKARNGHLVRYEVEMDLAEHVED